MSDKINLERTPKTLKALPIGEAADAAVDMLNKIGAPGALVMLAIALPETGEVAVTTNAGDENFVPAVAAFILESHSEGSYSTSPLNRETRQ